MSWLDHRTGIETAIRNFLYEEIPASSGWHQVFGSIECVLSAAWIGFLGARRYSGDTAVISVALAMASRSASLQSQCTRTCRGIHHRAWRKEARLDI